jgi:lycopene cyclase domain-containing protein
MELNNFAYLLVLLGTVAVPLIFGFDKKLQFFSNFKYLLPAMLFSGAIFIILDLRFTERGIWSFTPEYLLGKNLLDLPIEEWLYFLAVPLLGTFIYEYLKQRFPGFERPNHFLAISLGLLLVFGVAGYLSRQKVYPFFIFFLITIYFGYTIFRNRFKEHFTKFYLSFLILLIPFIIISGILTALPIIEYNPQFNLGIRLFSIPIENFASLFLLQLMNITIYEYLKERRIY